jgi:hypothetical protein
MTFILFSGITGPRARLNEMGLVRQADAAQMILSSGI